MKVSKKVIASYDESEIIEFHIEDRLDNWEDYYPDLTEKPSYEVVQDDVLRDTDIYSFEWEDMTDYLTTLMNKRGYWKAKVNNFGWRSLDGVKYFKAFSGNDFLHKILPDTDCTFYIHKFGRGFAIQNYHHDSPMGNEWYYIVPIKESTYYKYK